MLFVVAYGLNIAPLTSITIKSTASNERNERTIIKGADISVDKEKAVADLAEMLKCKTISDKNHENEDEAEFERFRNHLPRLFPSVFEKCETVYPSDRAILIKWSGENHDSPTVLMSHYDVVSVEEEKWEKPAFSGIVEDEILWGRGSIDTKVTLNGALQAAESLIKEDFVPKQDVYFAFAGDEEINGHGARDIVKIFQENAITPGIVVDEGGAVVNNVFPGVKRPCAMIGIAEKGMVNIEICCSRSTISSFFSFSASSLRRLI